MTVAVVGLGLIGGSLAKALSRAGHDVLGVDRPGPCRAALRARAIARRVTLEQAAGEAAVVVLAAPPAANRQLLRQLARVAPARLAITDVGSVKAGIVRDAARLGLSSFVGGHPIAGRERSGFRAASAELFRGRPWILTPSRSPGAEARVRRLVLATGARPVRMRAEAHDRLMAFVSHLPQVVAWALLRAARNDTSTRRRLALAGPGFRDMTRLAKSPRGLWREILRENRREIARALRAFAGALSRESLWG
jgi:prephenate dehydrogenase